MSKISITLFACLWALSKTVHHMQPKEAANQEKNQRDGEKRQLNRDCNLISQVQKGTSVQIGENVHFCYDQYVCIKTENVICSYN